MTEGTILVAGGSGLIGANLSLRLEKMAVPFVSTRFSKGPALFPNSVQCDLTDYRQCLSITTGISSLVISAAAISGAARSNPSQNILPNVKIAAGLLEACAVNGVRTVVLLSSSSVYQPSSHPIREEELDLNLAPYPSYLEAGSTNRFLEQLASLYCRAYGMRVVVLRPSSVYGPFDKFGSPNSNVIPSLIVRAMRGEAPFEVWGSPLVVRDFVYVEDVVDDILASLFDESIPADSPINVGSGLAVTIGDAVDIILKRCGHGGEVVFNGDRPTAIPYRALDTAKHAALFGGKPRTGLAAGIARTVAWLSAQQEGEAFHGV